MRTIATAKNGHGLDAHASPPRLQDGEAESHVAVPYRAQDLGHGIDLRDQAHHDLWSHHVDSDDASDYLPPSLRKPLCAPSVAGPVLGAGPLGDCRDEFGHATAGAFFKGGDWVLHHGGQIALDIGGFVPGVNVLTEGAQAAYHGMHAAYDESEGRADEAREERWEAGEHVGFALLNLVSGEGGEVAEAAEHVAEEGGVVDRIVEGGEEMRSRMQARVGMKGPAVTAEAVHRAHKAFDIAETGWDTTASVVQALSGTHVPFVGGLVPWMRGSEEKE